MDEFFWRERWASGQIGFHLPTPHPLLAAHHDAIAAARRIYVPLCGKTVDLTWLASRDHDVVGVELVPAAVEQLWQESALEPSRRTIRQDTARQDTAGQDTAGQDTAGQYAVHHVDPDVERGRGRLDVLVGDALAVDAALFTEAAGGLADAIYDRAALVALHPDQRVAYAAALRRVLRPGGRILLIAFSYDQTKLDGPPWSVDETTVRALFSDAFAVETLAVRDESLGPKFVAAGVTALHEICLCLNHRGTP